MLASTNGSAHGAGVGAASAALVAAAGGSTQKRIRYIAAATAALRRRVDALRAHQEPEAAEAGSLRHDDASAVEAALAEVRSLMVQLRPLAGIASEFRQKWDRQKAQLLLQREAEIAGHFRQEAVLAAERLEHTTEEELQVLSRESEHASQEAARKLSAAHRIQLELAVSIWRSKAKGADTVEATDVDRALRASLQRVAKWSEAEEQRLMSGWTQELAKGLTQVYGLDEEALAAAEDTQGARRDVLEAALQKNWKGLQACRAELQEQLTERAAELQEAANTSQAKRSAVMSATAQAAAGKASRSRIAVAKSEAQAALDAHRRAAEAQVDAAAQREVARTLAFQAAMAEVGPLLTTRLDNELAIMRGAVINLVADPPASPSLNKRSLARGNSSPLSSSSERSQGQSGGQPMRSSLPPGRPSQAEPRARLRSTVSFEPTSTILRNPISFQGPSPVAEGDEEDEDSSDESETEKSAKSMKSQQLVAKVTMLRAKLQAAQANLAKGDWNGDWRKDLAEAANLGRGVLRDAEAALEGQANVLRNRGADEDAQMFSGTFMQLAQHAKTYARTIREEMAKTRNVKGGLAKRRTEYIREVMQRHEQDATERELLPLVSQLSRDTEMVTEVGRAIERGSNRFPVAVVAGAWRQSVKSALQLLLKLWPGAGTSVEDQRAFLSKLLVALAKNPAAAELMFRAAPPTTPANVTLRLNSNVAR